MTKKDKQASVPGDSWLKKFHHKHLNTKQRKALVTIAGVLTIGLLGAAAWVVGVGTGGTADETNGGLLSIKTKHKKQAEEPAVIPRRLDGIVVARADANNVPYCIMIENAAFGGVRPQSGLSQAQIVYEMIVEGGITRLMAVFAGERIDQIGPVRSARDTYLEFASEYNCSYAHAGGSYTAMQALRNFSLRDIDGLREPTYFWRDSNRFAPHNLFTSSDKQEQAIVDHSWHTQDPPSYVSWLYADALPTATASELVGTINILFGGSYDVTYRYNSDTNVYERSNAGVAHTDANTGNVLTVNNIIIQHVQDGALIEGKGRINWPVTGEGIVDIYHDGRHFSGTWKKADRLSRTEFFDASGAPIPLRRGNSWVEIVPPHILTSVE